MKRMVFISLLLVMLFSLVGCTGASSKIPSSPMTQTNGDLTASLSFNPDPPVMMSAVEMTLTLTDSSGKGVDDAQVSYDLTMPAMPMPPNQPEAAGQGNGIYLTEATFTMGGEWQAAAIVVVNGETLTFTFDFKVG